MESGATRKRVKDCLEIRKKTCCSAMHNYRWLLCNFFTKYILEKKKEIQRLHESHSPHIIPKSCITTIDNYAFEKITQLCESPTRSSTLRSIAVSSAPSLWPNATPRHRDFESLSKLSRVKLGKHYRSDPVRVQSTPSGISKCSFTLFLQ